MFWRHILLPIGFSVLVSLLCLTPGGDFPGSPFLSFDKLSHAVFFMLLSFQWAVGLKKQNRFVWFRRNSFAVSMLGSIVFGGLLELAQHFFLKSRGGDWKDWMADAVGVLGGLLLYLLVFGKDGFREGTDHRHRSNARHF